MLCFWYYKTIQLFYVAKLNTTNTWITTALNCQHLLWFYPQVHSLALVFSLLFDSWCWLAWQTLFYPQSAFWYKFSAHLFISSTFVSSFCFFWRKLFYFFKFPFPCCKGLRWLLFLSLIFQVGVIFLSCWSGFPEKRVCTFCTVYSSYTVYIVTNNSLYN